MDLLTTCAGDMLIDTRICGLGATCIAGWTSHDMQRLIDGTAR